MEVKIGMDRARELAFTMDGDAASVEAVITSAVRCAALNGDPFASISGDDGRRYLIPATKIAYIEIGNGADKPARRLGYTVPAVGEKETRN